MKKFLLIAILLIGSFALNAQIHYYRASYFNIKFNNAEWVGWKDSGVGMTINYNTRHIEIDSKEPQVIDYTSIIKTQYDGYVMYSASATDRKYNLITIGFQVFNNGKTFIIIQYEDYTYAYDVVEIDPD